MPNSFSTNSWLEYFLCIYMSSMDLSHPLSCDWRPPWGKNLPYLLCFHNIDKAHGTILAIHVRVTLTTVGASVVINTDHCCSKHFVLVYILFQIGIFFILKQYMSVSF